MKKTTILFVILYLVIFVSVSWWAYNKYFRNTSAISGETQTISFNKNKTIFYTIENNLYLLNSDNLNKSTNQIGTLRLQSTGEVQTINFDQKNEFIVYSSINPQNASEIWKVDLADNHSEKIFAKEIPGFENYTNFRSPKMSNTERFMVFIAKLSANSGVDDIFLWDIEQNSIENLTKQTIKSKISAICWSGSEQKIYYAAEDTTGSLVSLMDLKAINQNVFVSPDKITRMEATRDRLILSLQDANLTTNLSYILYAKPQSIIPITDLASPKTLVNFDLSSDFKKIIYHAALQRLIFIFTIN